MLVVSSLSRLFFGQPTSESGASWRYSVGPHFLVFSASFLSFSSFSSIASFFGSFETLRWVPGHLFGGFFIFPGKIDVRGATRWCNSWLIFKGNRFSSLSLLPVVCFRIFLPYFVGFSFPYNAPHWELNKRKIDVCSGDVLSSSSTFSLFFFSPGLSSLISYDFYVPAVERKIERELFIR